MTPDHSASQLALSLRTSWLFSWPAALAWITIFNLACLPLRDFWYPDEPDMARVTLDMVTRSDYLQPYRMGKLFNDYPPLFYWLASVFGRASAWSELGLRLPTLLSALGLLAALAAWVERRLDERAACWSVIVLGTAYAFHWQSINMHLDMLLALGVTGAVLCFDHASSTLRMRARVAWYAASALAMGVASLTKGPIGLLLPCAILGLDALCAREWRRLLPLAICGATGSLFLLAWATAFSAHAGADGLIYFLTRQNLDRFRGGRSHEQPFYYYLGTLWMDLAPWSLLLVPASIDAWRAARRGERSARLLLCWFGFGLAFFSAAASKRSVYLLPILPSAAALLARYISERIENQAPLDRWVRAQAVAGGGALILVGLVLPAGLGRWLWDHESLRSFHIVSIGIVTLTLLACGVTQWRVALSSSLVRAWSTVAVTTALAYFVAHSVLLPALDEPLSARSDARWLASRIAEQTSFELGYFGKKVLDVPKETTALEFYGGFTIHSVSEPSAVEAYLARQPSTVLLVQKRDMDRLVGSTGRELRIERKLLIGDDEFVAVSDASNSAASHQEIAPTRPGPAGSKP